MVDQATKDDAFIFDCVLHAIDHSNENLLTEVRGATRSRDISRGSLRKRGDALLPDKAWTSEDLYRVEFENTTVDMAMTQTIPLFDWYRLGLSPVEANYRFAAAHPERVVFCGGVDPSYHGGKVLDEMTRQVEEWGAKAFKFYNAHRDGRTWRCDDEKVAYPMYEHAAKLGITLMQFHKGFALGTNNIEDLRPNDLQRAALDFPDMQFVIYHLALPYFEECVSIAARFENVYLALAGNVAFSLTQPRPFQKHMGELLRSVGSERIFFGSEAPLQGSPQPWIDLLWDFQIPDDLMANYGYPQITDQDKRNILGENFARVLGIDVGDARENLRRAG